MKRVITSSEPVIAEDNSSMEDRFNESLNNLKDDFNYLIESVDKMVRDGNAASAMELVVSVNDMINDSISDAITVVDSE